MEFRSVFISDVHLGSRACNAGFLGEFLSGVSAENLFIVGDLIDLERLARRWHWPPLHSEVLEKLLCLVRRGTKVYYVPGNHDSLVRQVAGTNFGGVRIVANHIHCLADGRRLLITHGDEFDAVVRQRRLLGMLGSLIYGRLVALNYWLNAVRRLLGLEYWSLANYVKRHNPQVSIMANSFKQALCQYARNRGCDGVVAGHIHTAEISGHQGILYCNPGDWVESCTTIVEDYGGNLQLITWPERARAGRHRLVAEAYGGIGEGRGTVAAVG